MWSPTALDPSADSALSVQRGRNHHKPAFTTSIGRWKTDLSKEEVTCIQSITGDTMAMLGYEVETL
jgi:hypothetical protein